MREPRFWLTATLLLAACSETSTPLPCDVDQLLEERCRLCHGDPLDFHAPMPLLDWEDTQAAAPSDGDTPVWQKMQARVHDAGDPMPPEPLDPLEASELETLDAWFASGAPPADEATPRCTARTSPSR